MDCHLVCLHTFLPSSIAGQPVITVKPFIQNKEDNLVSMFLYVFITLLVHQKLDYKCA